MIKTINKAYKFRFYPDKELKTLLAKTFGCVRFVYNKTLDYSEKHYQNKVVDPEKYKALTSTDRINYVKTLKDTPEFSFLKEVNSISLQQSVMNLNTAYSKFFTKKAGYPNYKKKQNSNSFTITGQASIRFKAKKFNQIENNKDLSTIHNKNINSKKHKKKHKPNLHHVVTSKKAKLNISNFEFYLPKHKKPLNIKFTRDFNHLNVSSVFVSQEPCGDYFISFSITESINTNLVNNENNNPHQKISFDLGLITTAMTYNGVEFKSMNIPDLIKQVNLKIKKSQQSLSRKTKGSNNRNKQRIKLNKLHQKRTNILTDLYQKQSSIMINENQVIMRENLDIKQMQKNRLYSNSIQNVAWKRFISMLEYKADWHDREIVAVDKYYPSSKLCSGCHTIYKELSIKERTWTCQSCGMTHDRDENACINLYHYKATNSSKKTVGTTANACGNLNANISANELMIQESSALMQR